MYRSVCAAEISARHRLWPQLYVAQLRSRNIRKALEESAGFLLRLSDMISPGVKIIFQVAADAA